MPAGRGLWCCTRPVLSVPLAGGQLVASRAWLSGQEKRCHRQVPSTAARTHTACESHRHRLCGQGRRASKAGCSLHSLVFKPVTLTSPRSQLPWLYTHGARTRPLTTRPRRAPSGPLGDSVYKQHCAEGPHYHTSLSHWELSD